MPGVIEQMRAQMADWGLAMVCAICQSREVQFEDSESTFTSMEQAQPVMAYEQLKQILAGAAIAARRRAQNN